MSVTPTSSPAKDGPPTSNASTGRPADPQRIVRRLGITQWSVVLLVGLGVIAIVLGLKLIPRLSDGQKVLNAARPAFTVQRVAGAQAGITAISHDVDMADPIVTPAGGGASEVPALLAYVAHKEGVSDTQALALLKKDFPHTTALLTAIPLSAVTAELPRLLSFLGTTLKLTPGQLSAALASNFPALNQAVVNLPTVTNGWESVPSITGLTRFDGEPVRTVPEVRSYFGSDVIPAVKAQRENFANLDGTSSLNWIAPLLLVIGIVVTLLALAMLAGYRSGRVSRRASVGAASLVPVVGVVVLGLALGLRLDQRVQSGQRLLDGLAPAFTQQRVAGDRAGIDMVSAIVNMENPIMTPSGGAAGEVPKLISFLSAKTGLSQTAVLATLQKDFPHTTALLQALPLSAVSAELPAVFKALGPGVIPLIPRLAQTIAAAPLVTSGWNEVPGSAGFTRFDGSPVRTMPQVRDYFSKDLIPVLEAQRGNFAELSSTSTIDNIGIIVIMLSIIVIEFGALMVFAARRMHPSGPGQRA